MNAWGEAAARVWAGWMWPMFWQMTLLILVVAIIDRSIRRWAWPQLRLALWSLVLIKLVLPPTLASPVSVTSTLFSPDAVPYGLEHVGEPCDLAALAPVSDSSHTVAIDLLDGPSGAIRTKTVLFAPAAIYEPTWPVKVILIWLTGVVLLGACVLLRV